jgi:hypothetical protein
VTQHPYSPHTKKVVERIEKLFLGYKTRYSTFLVRNSISFSINIDISQQIDKKSFQTPSIIACRPGRKNNSYTRIYFYVQWKNKKTMKDVAEKSL